MQLSNYVQISRRDRPDESGWGGIAFFARFDISENVAFLRNSPTLELAWHALHSDVGAILIGVWYRPPQKGDVASVAEFEKELSSFLRLLRLNWQQNFSHCSIIGQVMPYRMQKLWTPLATFFVEKKF